jgi:hypothetical protein
LTAEPGTFDTKKVLIDDKYQRRVEGEWDASVYIMISVIICLSIVLIITAAYFLDKIGWKFLGQLTSSEQLNLSSQCQSPRSYTHTSGPQSPNYQMHSGGEPIAANQHLDDDQPKI